MAAVVKAAKEPVTCARPGCRNQFIPAHGKHVYCSTTCKGRVTAYKHALGLGGRR